MVIAVLKVLGKSVGGENAKVPRYEVKWLKNMSEGITKA